MLKSLSWLLITSLAITLTACKRKTIYRTSNLAWRYLAKASQNEAIGNKKGAFKDYDTLIALEPDKPDGYYSRAILDTSLKDYDGSVRDINKAIGVLPEDDFTRLPVYLSLRGDVEKLAGKTAEAITDYKAAIEICNQGLQKYAGNDFARDEKRENEAKLKSCQLPQ
jgi:tetratricopeptide (TPR) repeat protein